MGDNDLTRLLEAEKKARNRVARSKEQAKVIIAEAEKSIKEERSNRINDFRSGHDIKIKEAESTSRSESERIRREGVDLAKDLKGDSRKRIPEAVNVILDHIKTE